MIRKITSTENILIKGAITKLCPEMFLRHTYKLQDKSSDKCVFSLSFDIDFKEDIDALPYLIGILKKYGIKASFASVGNCVEKYPEEHLELVKEGHEILNHTYSHPHNDSIKVKKFYELSEEEVFSEIKKSHEIYRKYLGIEIKGFRLPHFGYGKLIRNLDFNMVYRNLKKAGYLYSSSTIGVKTKTLGSPFLTEGGIWEFPVSGCPKHPYGVLDTYHSFRSEIASHKKEGEFYNLFKTLLDIGIENNGYVNVYFDPQDVYKNKDFERIMELLKENKGKIDILNYSQIYESQLPHIKMEDKIGKRFDKLEKWFPTQYNKDDLRIRYILENISDKKKILDVGCGKGAMIKMLTGDVHGIDISQELLKTAMKIPNVTIKEGSATNIPYPDDTFDYVICNEVIEHIPDTEKAIKEMVRVLRKDGKIILIDKNKYAVFQNLLIELVYIKNYKKDLRMYPKDFGFKEKRFTQKGVENLLKKYCREVKSKNLNFPCFGLFIGWVGTK